MVVLMGCGSKGWGEIWNNNGWGDEIVGRGKGMGEGELGIGWRGEKT